MKSKKFKGVLLFLGLVLLAAIPLVINSCGSSTDSGTTTSTIDLKGATS